LSGAGKGEQQASGGKNTHEEDKEKGARSRVVVSVTGMSCVTCARAIEKQVGKLKGVEDVKTAIMLNKVFIDYDPKLVDPATIRKAVDKTGYKSYMTVEQKR
jgi:copper chaperone CopZ